MSKVFGCSCSYRRELERNLDACKNEKNTYITALNQCQVGNKECIQQTTDLLKENQSLQADKEALQAEVASLKQTLQEIEDGTLSKDQQTQGSYLHSEENTIGMAGVHQENKEQADIVMP